MSRRSILTGLLAALALLEAGGEAVLRLTVGDSAQGRAAGLLLVKFSIVLQLLGVRPEVMGQGLQDSACAVGCPEGMLQVVFGAWCPEVRGG